MDSIQQKHIQLKKEGLKFYKERARANVKSRTNELIEMKLIQMKEQIKTQGEQIEILTNKLLKKEESNDNTDNTDNLKEEDLEKPKVIDYLVVYGICSSSPQGHHMSGIKTLTSQVIKFTKLGWVLLGGVSHAQSTYSQAMVLYSK